jgi:hypothetical protein
VVPLLLLMQPVFVLGDSWHKSGGHRGGAENNTGDAVTQHMEGIGPFYGYDKKSGKIWIDDRAYTAHRALRVQGTSKKLGLLSDIKRNERVGFTTVPASGKTRLPEIIEIRRH